MLCQEIHGSESDCPAAWEPDWKFCPMCGRKTASLRIESTVLVAPFTQALPLSHKGIEPVRFDCQVDAQASPEARALKVTSKPASVAAGQMRGLRFEWSGPLPARGAPLRVPLQVVSDDGPPRDPFEADAIRTRVRTWSVLLSVTSPAPPRLHIEPAVALFHPRCRERTLSVANTGDSPLLLAPIEAPFGYSVEPQSDPPRGMDAWAVPARGERTWTLRMLSAAPVGERALEVWSRDGSQKKAVRLLRQDDEKVEAATTYIVGVDFGTSGTSVWVRSGKDSSPAYPLADPSTQTTASDDKLRFPTEMFIPMKDGVEFGGGTLIGHDARLAEGARRTSEEGLFVREIKTLLRGDAEPFVAEHGRQYTVDALLARYFRVLKEKVIDPALLAPGATVAWNFSVPVLDGHRGGAHVLFERQRARLEKAVRAAGYVTTGSTLQFFTEPYCAAVYLLHGHGQYRYPTGRSPQEGDWACVFDSGGGTTDVVLGRLRFDDGRLRFEEVATLGGYQANAKSQEVSTFGGEALSRRTMLFLTVAHKYLRISHRPGISPLELAEMQRTVEEQGEKALTQEDVWVRTSGLWRDEAEAHKKKLAAIKSEATTGSTQYEDVTREKKRLPVRRADFDEYVVNVRLEPLQKEMSRSVFATHAAPPADSGGDGHDDLPLPSEVRWVFGVGGNCRVRRIGEWLDGFFSSEAGGNVQELEKEGSPKSAQSDRMLAVSGGTVWAAQARQADALPYNIWVEDESGARPFEALANESISDAALYPECARRVPPGQEAKFHVWVEGQVAVGGQGVPFRGCVGAFSLRNNDHVEADARTMSATFRFSGRRLLIESDEAGSTSTKFEYTV